MSEWQLIETAPKGRPLLLGYRNSLGNWRTVRGEWTAAQTTEWDGEDIEEGWFEVAENADGDSHPNCWSINPTHWQPLPEPPL